MKISVITATYNSGATLRDTVESVLRQTYHNIEYIIVDGDSHDNSMDIVREYEPLFNGRLHYVSEPDNGLYDAMNKGIAMATGDVIGILNSDDFYTSDNIVEQVADAMTDNPKTDAVYGDIHFVNGNNLTKCVRYYSSKHFRRWQMRLGFMPAHPSFYCRREVYLNHGVFDDTYRIAADFELLLRFIFVHRITIKYLPADFVTMRMGGVSTSGVKSYRNGCREHLRAYRNNGVYSNVFLESLRYIYKAVELLTYRIKTALRRASK